ncbi:MAG: molybdopterin-synthase adenylyltransferase MoeB [Acidobacteria bacterium]|nr:molybdopterin-synthase adenylyltransferase MoeB [Acidobacteriota bacterium]
MERGPGLTPAEVERYARQLRLPELGLEGQLRLRHGSVLVAGAGGLGAPAALYLVAAGVGRVGLADADAVEASNLQRQVLFGEADLGRPKVEAARERLAGLNPGVRIEAHRARLTAANALDLVGAYDVVLDGTDNFAAKYLLSDACVLADRPLVLGAISRFSGDVTVFGGARGPCYRCLFPTPPAAGEAPDCGEAGVLGVVPGVIGALEATEAIKLLLGRGRPLRGRLLRADLLAATFRELEFERDPACPACGESPTLTALADEPPACAARAAEHSLEIAPAELRARLARGERIVLLDVREPWECAQDALAGARNIPLGQLTRRAGELDREDEIVAYCGIGARSAAAVAWLRSAGFARARSLGGGIEAWRES